VSLPGDAPSVKLVSSEEIQQWPRAESRIYLVELSTTPSSVGHVAPYRHDYRKAREPYKKGDLVVLEGIKPGTQDVGTIRKVLTGEKGEQLAATIAQNSTSGGGPATGMRRLLWRCSGLEQARREGQAATLEKTVLPLLAARLPDGAEAIGVGASLDGFFLRLFVHMQAQSGPTRQKSAAAAAALGALLGCETELLAAEAPPAPAAAEAAGSEPGVAVAPGGDGLAPAAGEIRSAGQDAVAEAAAKSAVPDKTKDTSAKGIEQTKEELKKTRKKLKDAKKAKKKAKKEAKKKKKKRASEAKPEASSSSSSTSSSSSSSSSSEDSE